MKTNTLCSLAIVMILFILSSFPACKKDDSKNTPPIARFTVDPSEGTVITIFNFNASGCTDNEDSVISLQIRWDWEQDNIWDTDWSGDKVISHQFSLAGNYMVIMQVRDSDGLNDTVACQVNVTAGIENTEPIAAFNISPASGSTSTIFNFDASLSNDQQDPPSILNVRWDFQNDGTWDTPFSTVKTATYQYSDDGIYSFKMEVMDSDGLTDEEIGQIQVTPGGINGVPCPGMPSFSYQGQTYNTVIIGSQCWMKENLNYAIGNSRCYGDNPENCKIYGRLYDWTTIMNGESSSNAVPSGVQGICAAGWHVPSDEEWKILEGTTDSLYGTGNEIWDTLGWRGINAGRNLKSTIVWSNNGNGKDKFGFSALPGGNRDYSGSFSALGTYSIFWTSTANADWPYDAWYRYMQYDEDAIYRTYFKMNNNYSLRCLKN